jgi:hypothetical protein
MLSLAYTACAFVISPAYPPDYNENLLALTLAGIVNRENPQLWLNASSPAPGMGYVAVNWPFPQADETWIEFLREKKQMQPVVLADASVCTLVQPFLPLVKGVVLYEESSSINSLKFLAMTAGGLYDALPVTAQMQQKHACLGNMTTVFTIPAASSFPSDLHAYSWATKTLLPQTSKQTQGGACKAWANYSCGAWADPLGTAAMDYVVSQRGFIHNLSPDATSHPDQAAMFNKISAHMSTLGVFTGWAAPEGDMVGILAKTDGVVQCGAPNLSFLSSTKVAASQLPYHRSLSTVDPTKTYVVFQTNEGDTPKNAYGFRAGNWLSPKRGIYLI